MVIALSRRAGTIDPLNANSAMLLWAALVRDPAGIALVDGDRVITYADLAAAAAAVAAGVQGAGVSRPEPVAIFLDRGWQAAAAFFGVLAAGGIAVLIDESLRPRQVEHILSHSGAQLLLTDTALVSRQPRAIASAVRVLDVNSFTPSRQPFAPVPRIGPDVAQLVYTSGSTGEPKAVALSHANVVAATRAVQSYLGLQQRDRIISLLSFSFVYGQSQLCCAIGAGATLVIERSTTPANVVETIRSWAVTVVAAVPSLWSLLVRAPGFESAFPALRVMTSAGGHLPVSVVRALRRAQPGVRLFLMYGLTEAMRCTYLPPEEVDRRPRSIGRAIPGGEVMVLREDGRPAAAGEIGELVYRGPTVALGYWNDAAATARVFRPNPGRPAAAPDTERVVYTGDLVQRDAEGFLYFVGRQDQMIKTLGYRVSPDEVVAVLRDSGEVADAAIVGEPDPVMGTRLVAFVVLAEGGSLGRINAHCGRELPRHLRPSRIELLEAMPVLPNGKPDLPALVTRAGLPQSITGHEAATL